MSDGLPTMEQRQMQREWWKVQVGDMSRYDLESQFLLYADALELNKAKAIEAESQLAATRARLAEYERVGADLIDMLDDLRLGGRDVPHHWWPTTRALYALVHDMPAVGTGDEGGPT